MLGCTMALRLAEAGFDVTVFEAGDHPGGLAAPWELDTPGTNVTWDRHYHVMLRTDDALRNLLSELELDSKLHWGDTCTGYFSNGRLSPMSSVNDFIRLPGLSLISKARLAATIAVGSHTRNPERLEQMSVVDWCTRWSGRAVFEQFWLPLLRSKLGDAWQETSAAFLWATIQRLTRARRHGLGGEQFGYAPGGYASVLACLVDRLADRGARVITGTSVTRVAGTSKNRLVLSFKNSPDEIFDHVVVTTDAPTADAICAGLSDSERSVLRGIRYQGIVCASLLLDAPLSPYYLTYLLNDAPFTAIVEMTALVHPAELGEHHLVYLPRYISPDSAMFDESDDAIRARFVAGLQGIHRQFRESSILAFRVSRVRRVFPIPTRGYSQRVPAFDATVPGLHLVGSAQIVNGTLNVNETIGLAEKAAKHLLAAQKDVNNR